MITFTYEDYHYYLHHLPMSLSETKAPYNRYPINNKHDKVYRDLLNVPYEFSLFLKKFLDYSVEPNKLIKYNRSYITEDYQDRYSDVVYKVKDEHTYFFVEHQSYIDGRISYRILNYYANLLSDIAPYPNLEKDYEFPTIIPILLYTGSRQWKLTPEIFDNPYSTYFMKNPEIFLNFKYKFVDIHNYSKEHLLHTDSIVSYMLAIDKCKSKVEVYDVLNKLSYIVTSNIRRSTFKRLIKYIFSHFLNKQKCNELLEKFTEKDDVNMKWILDVVREDLERERQEAIRKGKLQGICEGREEGLKEGRKEGRKYNIPINVDTIKEGYPILCA